MMPVWLIEADVFGTSFEPVKREIRAQGMAWDIVHPRPFLNGVIPVVGGHQLTDKDCVIFSGTYPLMRHMQLHHPWIPGGWCTAENFDCSAYYGHYGEHLLNHKHDMVTIPDGLSRCEELFLSHARNSEVFIRPAGLQKTFTGRCVDRGQFTLALQSVRYSADCILVAEPHNIEREWRVVVAGTRVVAASQYRMGGHDAVAEGCPPGVEAYVGEVLSSVAYRPDPIYMMDVCESEKSLRVLELNSFSCSGLYECDPREVVRTVKELALAAWQKAV